VANTENIAKWVEALRSGDFKQGKGALRTIDGSYCCLGVACEISGVVTLRDRENHPIAEYVSVDDERDASASVLPSAVRDWLGVESYNPHIVDEHGEGHALSLWNDSEDADFDKIADLIELKYLQAADVA
jgi:hypothetical protein